MKKILLLFLFAISINTLFSQALFEDFEDATITYSATPADDLTAINFENYFGRIAPDTDTPPTDISFTNSQGSGYYGAHDTDDANSGNIDEIMLNFTGVDITGLTNLAFSIFVAEDDDGGSQDWDSNSSFLVTYQIDGGGYTNLFAIESSGGTNTEPAEDTDFNGSGDGTAITDAFALFSKPIVGTGTTLDLRITISNLDAGDEDIAFDNITIEGDTPTPITLASFTAKPMDSEAVSLDWITSSEENNEYFSIEHSTNGRDFIAIDEVEGALNSTEMRYYNYMHKEATKGLNYYRLRQVDTDGTFSFSPIEVVNIAADIAIEVRPTIAEGTITMSIAKAFDKESTIEIYNVLGSLVSAEVLARGDVQKTLNVNDLQSGHYFIRLTDGLNTQTTRFIKK